MQARQAEFQAGFQDAILSHTLAGQSYMALLGVLDTACDFIACAHEANGGDTFVVDRYGQERQNYRPPQNVSYFEQAYNIGRDILLRKAFSTIGKLGENPIKGNGYWGGTFISTRNAAGGEVITAEGGIAQGDFRGIVEAGQYWGQEVKIISGVHADASGAVEPDLSLLKDDVDKFGHLPGVRVFDYTREKAAGRLGDILNGEGRIIAGFCNSHACLGNLIIQ